MTENERREWILGLEEKHLKGGVILSEWSAFLSRNADDAYCSGVSLADVLAHERGRG